LFIGPAEFTGALERKGAGRILRGRLPLGGDRLLERDLAALSRLVKRLQLREAVRCGGRWRREREHAHNEHSERRGRNLRDPHAPSPLPAGTSTSRLPLVCIGETSPAR